VVEEEQVDFIQQILLFLPQQELHFFRFLFKHIP